MEEVIAFLTIFEKNTSLKLTSLVSVIVFTHKSKACFKLQELSLDLLDRIPDPPNDGGKQFEPPLLLAEELMSSC